VSQPTVSRARKRSVDTDVSTEKRTGKDGKQYKASKRKKPQSKAQPQQRPHRRRDWGGQQHGVLGKKQLLHMTQLKSAGMRFLEVFDARQLARDASHCILTRFGVFIDGDLF